MINDKLRKKIEEYQNIPNAPFVQKHTSEYVRVLLESTATKYEEDAYSIIVKPKKLNDTKKKLLIMAHLDHPAAVLQNNFKGKLLGLIGTEKLIAYLNEHNIKLKVFDPSGKILGRANIEKVIPGPKQDISISSDFEIPTNSIGQFDIDSYKEDGDELLNLYNADDGVMVSVLLYMLEEGLLGDHHNTYIAFMKHEEVHQVSSWHVAKNNPFKLTDRDYILNLECLKTESIDNERFGKVEYTGGPVLQLSNTGCLFGHKNEGPNELELSLRAIAQEKDLQLQVGLIKDSCDSRPFSQFVISPNICSITIPNKYKHNGADDGMIRSEEIRQADVNTVVELLKALTNKDYESRASQIGESISEKLKKENEITDLALLKEKEILNKRLAVAYKDVVRRGYFYPETLLDKVNDFVYKVISYLIYLGAKLK